MPRIPFYHAYVCEWRDGCTGRRLCVRLLRLLVGINSRRALVELPKFAFKASDSSSCCSMAIGTFFDVSESTCAAFRKGAGVCRIDKTFLECQTCQQRFRKRVCTVTHKLTPNFEHILVLCTLQVASGPESFPHKVQSFGVEHELILNLSSKTNIVWSINE